MSKPTCVKDHHLIYLDDLRASGATNMYGAVPWIRDEYPELTKDQARDILTYWMHTFSERHPRTVE